MLYFNPSGHATATGQRLLLGQLLIRRGLISDDQLAGALSEQESTREYLGEILVRRGLLTEAQLTEALAEQLEIPCARLTNRPLDPSVLEMIPASLARRLRFVPLSRDDGRLQLAMANPFDSQSLDELRTLLNCEIQPMLAGRQEIDEAIQRLYGPAA